MSDHVDMIEQRQPPKVIRDCNRHLDCDAADARAEADFKAGKRRGPYIDHCHDSCCEECFGQ